MTYIKNTLSKFERVDNALLFFIAAIITGGYGDRLIHHGVLEYLDGDRVAQLICSFFLIIFSIEVFNDKVTSLKESLTYSLIIFIGYLIISKQSPKMFLISVVLLLINYLLWKKIEIIENNKNENTGDENSQENNNNIDGLKSIHKFILTITIFSVIIGVILYFTRQYNDHRNQSDSFIMFFLKFLFEGSNTIYQGKAKVFDNLRG
tara:strand:+ start:2241 stop:2858 length:618 start_codon:yes stop_codon:yes gene_type:complete